MNEEVPWGACALPLFLKASTLCPYRVEGICSNLTSSWCCLPPLSPSSRQPSPGQESPL